MPTGNYEFRKRKDIDYFIPPAPGLTSKGRRYSAVRATKKRASKGQEKARIEVVLGTENQPASSIAANADSDGISHADFEVRGEAFV
jgi:hypothetical protein